MIRVYIAGPYTSGSQTWNVNAAIQAAEKVREHGFVPFVPHLYHFWDFVSPHSYEYWMSLDRDWLKSCDVLLRLPGVSPGADREIADMVEWKKPVVTTIAELLELYEMPLRLERGFHP